MLEFDLWVFARVFTGLHRVAYIRRVSIFEHPFVGAKGAEGWQLLRDGVGLMPMDVGSTAHANILRYTLGITGGDSVVGHVWPARCYKHVGRWGATQLRYVAIVCCQAKICVCHEGDHRHARACDHGLSGLSCQSSQHFAFVVSTCGKMAHPTLISA